MKSVYIETSIVSYLVARPTSDLLVAACQKLTVDWWELRRSLFDIYTPDVVIDEAGKGDPEAAARRLDALSGIPILPVTEGAVRLSEALIQEGAIPAKALGDSLHVAVSAVHGVEYLLTWNYRHLDNAETKPLIRSVCAVLGYTSPEICTPQELMGEAHDA